MVRRKAVLSVVHFSWFSVQCSMVADLSFCLAPFFFSLFFVRRFGTAASPLSLFSLGTAMWKIILGVLTYLSLRLSIDFMREKPDAPLFRLSRPLTCASARGSFWTQCKDTNRHLSVRSALYCTAELIRFIFAFEPTRRSAWICSP